MTQQDPAEKHQKTFTIQINATGFTIHQKEISFEEIVRLAALPVPPGEPAYTVDYTKGEERKPKGSLTAGERVHVKDGMVFHVDVTCRS